MSVIFALFLHQVQAVSKCSCADVGSSYTQSPISFFATVSGKTATVTSQLKGLAATATSVQLQLPAECTIPISQTYFIAGTQGTSGAVSVTCFLAQSRISLPVLVLLKSQMISGSGAARCADGTTPVTCDKATVCSNSQVCPTSGAICNVNRCGGCSPVFSNSDGSRTCVTSCPDGSSPLVCTSNPCQGAVAPAACSSATCQVSSCNGCSATWIDADGKQVCTGHNRVRQCADVSGVTFGSGTTKLGFAIQGGVCAKITGSAKFGLPLFTTMAQCVSACVCRDQGGVSPGTGTATWFAVVNGRCSQVTGSQQVKTSLAISSFPSVAACHSACPKASTSSTAPLTPSSIPSSTPQPAAPYTGIRSTCTVGSPGCCPNGLTQEVCVNQNVGVYCQYLQCGSKTAARCVADPCNACVPAIYASDNTLIKNSQCTLALPAYTECNPLSTVTCPTGLVAQCGPKPSACPANWNARCIIDPCSCQPVWMNEDLRQPTTDCLNALVAKCVLIENCPTGFQCKPAPNQQQIISNLPSGYQLQCIQQTCSCAPTWIQAPVGGALVVNRVLPCTAAVISAGNCCPNNNQKQNCASVAQNTQQTCQSMVCTSGTGSSITVAHCSADPCNNCDVVATDSKGRSIPIADCTFGQSVGTVCPYNSAIHCPTATPVCPPLNTAVCPVGWKLNCVMDPCLCRSFWLDEDVRYTPEECTLSIQPPCIPANQCPSLTCTPVTQDMKEQIPPDVLASLVCVQAPCTCMPVWTSPSQAQQGGGPSAGAPTAHP